MMRETLDCYKNQKIPVIPVYCSTTPIPNHVGDDGGGTV